MTKFEALQKRGSELEAQVTKLRVWLLNYEAGTNVYHGSARDGVVESQKEERAFQPFIQIANRINSIYGCICLDKDPTDGDDLDELLTVIVPVLKKQLARKHKELQQVKDKIDAVEELLS